MDKIHTCSVYLLLLLLLTLENPKFYHHYFHPLLRCHQGSIQLGHLQWVRLFPYTQLMDARLFLCIL